LLEVEPQGANIKIEQARQIVKFVELAHTGARAVILNDAHLLNAHAANSLLKTLEEPPAKTWFFLIAPSAAAVLPTLRSRSQLIRFGALSKEAIQKLT